MTFATRAMLPFLVFLVHLSLITAVEMVYSVWTKIPDNTAVLTGVAAGQFKSNSDLDSFLHRVGKDVSSSTCHSLGAKGHTWYWTAKLKEDDVKALKTQKILRAVHVLDWDDKPKRNRLAVSTGEKLVKREATKSQDDAPRQLSFISSPEDEGNDLDVPYEYDERAGRGSRIYIIDGVVNPTASEWHSDSKRENRIEWLFAEPFSHHDKRDFDNHGSCVLSCAAGKKYGVAKEADLTVVQVEAEFALMERELDAYSQILDDIKKKHLINKAVVLEAADIEIPGSERGKAYVEHLATLIKELVSTYGAAVVTAQPGSSACDSYPCKYGDPTDKYHIPQIITVDASDIREGDYWAGGHTSWTTVYAPGSDRDYDFDDDSLFCIGGAGNEDQDEGTSMATGMVAGLMAYYQSLGLTTAAARQRMISDAYKRKSNGPEMIWNGYLTG